MCIWPNLKQSVPDKVGRYLQTVLGVVKKVYHGNGEPW